MIDVGIVGVGTYLPEKTMKAAEIARLTNGVWSEDAVINKLGIKQRYLPGPDDGTQEMGAKAALKCLENTGVDPKEIDVILCIGEEWKEYPLTTSACYIQDRIGATNAWGIDVQNRCCTCVSAMKIAALVVLAVSIILGVAVGFISLRIEGIFLAIVTLGLSEILYQIFTNWIGFTGGPNGSSASIPIFQKWLGLSTTTSKRAMFIVLVVVVVFLMIITFNLCKSSTGRAMLAMKNSTSAAQAMGISLLRYRLLAFVLSTVYAGIGGIMFMSYLGYASPTNWTLMFSLNLLAAVIIGGTRSLWGTIVGCFIVFGLTPIFFQDIAFLRDNSWFMYALIGVLIILIIMFYQGGLVQLVRDIKNGIKKARAKRRLYRYGEEE